MQNNVVRNTTLMLGRYTEIGTRIRRKEFVAHVIVLKIRFIFLLNSF